MSKHIHFTGACGRAIGGLAAELNQLPQWEISASDDCQFAPMDQILRDRGLEVADSYKASHISKSTDALVVGSHITDDNVEVIAAEKNKISIFNMAQFLNRHILKTGKRIVVAGTNGKTTTASMLTHIMNCAGLHPDYLIGGSSPELESPVRFRNSKWTVIEGDEYISGQNDAQAKFLYYKPDVLIITNLSYDHAEVFPDLSAIAYHFKKLVSLLPKSGSLIIPYGDKLITQIARLSCARVITVGQDSRSDFRITQVRSTRSGMRFNLNSHPHQLSSMGKMNVLNASMAIAAATRTGIKSSLAAKSLTNFSNASGRLELLLENDLGTYILDEGYHPDALRENIAALRLRFPKRNLTIALLPRFTGGNRGFQMDALPDALSAADRVILAGVFDPVSFSSGAFSNRKLAARLKRRGVTVSVIKSIGRLPDFLHRSWILKDVVLCSVPPGHDFIYEPTLEWMENHSSKNSKKTNPI